MPSSLYRVRLNGTIIIAPPICCGKGDPRLTEEKSGSGVAEALSIEKSSRLMATNTAVIPRQIFKKLLEFIQGVEKDDVEIIPGMLTTSYAKYSGLKDG